MSLHRESNPCSVSIVVSSCSFKSAKSHSKEGSCGLDVTSSYMPHPSASPSPISGYVVLSIGIVVVGMLFLQAPVVCSCACFHRTQLCTAVSPPSATLSCCIGSGDSPTISVQHECRITAPCHRIVHIQ
jgi:hypothetical protein